MTARCAVVHTRASDASAAGAELGRQVVSGLGGERPDAIILFASTKYEHRALLDALHGTCAPKVLVGGSSAGEFTDTMQGEGLACAVAFHAPEMRFRGVVARDRHGRDAGKIIASAFERGGQVDYRFRTALVLADAMAGDMESLVHELTEQTGGNYQFFGGGVGGDDLCQGGRVFIDKDICPRSVAILEILSNKPIGIGVGHGWEPCGPPMRVTEAAGKSLLSLNATPVEEVFREHALAINQRFDSADPFPFFLNNVLGIQSERGYKLRMPLAINPDRSISCATEIPAGSIVRVMVTNPEATSRAAASAARSAIEMLGDNRPLVALAFDCVTTRIRLGAEVGKAIAAMRASLGGASLVGCNTVGEIARFEGQFGDFHNCTALVCAIPM